MGKTAKLFPGSLGFGIWSAKISVPGWPDLDIPVPDVSSLRCADVKDSRCKKLPAMTKLAPLESSFPQIAEIS